MTRLLEVEDLKVHFPVSGGLFGNKGGCVHAVDGVSLFIERGETLGIVGESGCGKTTLGHAILRLVEPTSGRVVFDGMPIDRDHPDSIYHLRRGMQLIFQDPCGSLNPRVKVGKIIGEPMRLAGIARGEALSEKVAWLMEKVGLSPEQAGRYPHEFSGGQRQRIGIARALGMGPSLVIGDEPVSALDVSIQAQIVNLLKDLQEEFGLSYMLIAHDLAVVEHLCDRIAVMYLGRIVETGDRDAIYNHPAHPYTRALLSAIPVPDPARKTDRILLEGDVPSPMHPPSGCRFHPRCPNVTDRCRTEAPGMRNIGNGHSVGCHLCERSRWTGSLNERR